MSAIPTSPSDIGLASSIGPTITSDDESIRRKLIHLLRGVPPSAMDELEPLLLECIELPLEEFILTILTQVSALTAKLELQLEIQTAKADIAKYVKSELREAELSDTEFAITVNADGEDEDEEYLVERAAELMNCPNEEWGAIGEYILELKEQILQVSHSV